MKRSVIIFNGIGDLSRDTIDTVERAANCDNSAFDTSLTFYRHGNLVSWSSVYQPDLAAPDDSSVQNGEVDVSSIFGGDLGESWYVIELENDSIYTNAPDIAARLSTGVIDRHWIAGMLINNPPSFLRDSSPWRGVRNISARQVLTELGISGKVSVKHLSTIDSFECASHAVKNTLNSIFEEISREYGCVSSDLSGGMDSTTLAAFASYHELLGSAYISTPDDKDNNDLTEAKMVADALEVDLNELVPFSAGASLSSSAFSSPDLDLVSGIPMWGNAGSYLSSVLSDSLRRGNRAHLIGLGGDDLFSPHPSALKSFSKISLMKKRRRRVVDRWMKALNLSRIDGYRSLLESRGARDEAEARLGGQVDRYELSAREVWSWFPGLHLPSFCTDDTRNEAASLFFSLFDTSGVDSTEGTIEWAVREQVRWQRRNVTLMNSELLDARKVPLLAPFLDDRLVDIVLSLDPLLHLGDETYKPILRGAITGVVPKFSVDRKDKGDFTSSYMKEFVSARDTISETIRDGLLVSEGFISERGFLSALFSPNISFNSAEEIVSCYNLERWVRCVSTTA